MLTSTRHVHLLCSLSPCIWECNVYNTLCGIKKCTALRQPFAVVRFRVHFIRMWNIYYIWEYAEDSRDSIITLAFGFPLVSAISFLINLNHIVCSLWLPLFSFSFPYGSGMRVQCSAVQSFVFMAFHWNNKFWHIPDRCQKVSRMVWCHHTN